MPIDMSAAKAPVAPTPPPARRGRPPGSKNKAAATEPRRPTLDVRTEGLMSLGQLLQGGLMMGKQYADAAAVGMHWNGVAVEVARIAEENASVAGVVDSLIMAGPYAALIGAVMPLALQIAANHKMIPVSPAMGVVPPEVLQAQMETQILQAQTNAIRQQQNAAREAERAQAEFAAAQHAERNIIQDVNASV